MHRQSPFPESRQHYWKKKKIDRPELVVICDVSHSVMHTVRFLLLFLYGLNQEVAKVRTFAFCTNLCEVSHILETYPVAEALSRIQQGTDLPLILGRTDYARSLGDFRREVLTVVPGERIAYVTDARFTPENAARIIDLARGADYLFIEATFAAAESARAAERCHLTTRQAGGLARQAGAARVIPFHFSPRHQGNEELLRQEVAAAFAGEA